jgi:hypothetical protein
MGKSSHAALELAGKYKMPVQLVEHLFAEETESVSQQARITAFIQIFVARRVEERLRTKSFQTSGDKLLAG